jgi:hypothetical protein
VATQHLREVEWSQVKSGMSCHGEKQKVVVCGF